MYNILTLMRFSGTFSSVKFLAQDWVDFSKFVKLQHVQLIFENCCELKAVFMTVSRYFRKTTWQFHEF